MARRRRRRPRRHRAGRRHHHMIPDSLYDFTADPAFLSRTAAESRFTIRSRPHYYRREPNGSHTDISGHMRSWYKLGTAYLAPGRYDDAAAAWHHSSQDGPQ